MLSYYNTVKDSLDEIREILKAYQAIKLNANRFKKKQMLEWQQYNFFCVKRATF